MAKCNFNKTNLVKLIQEVENRKPSYGCVVQAFRELIEKNAAHQQNINQKVSIDVGKKSGDGFLSFLHSSFKNPLVTIQYCGDEPQLKISSFDKNNGGSTTLNLVMMENIVVKENRTGSDFLTYDVGFHYSPADLDYMIHVVM